MFWSALFAILMLAAGIAGVIALNIGYSKGRARMTIEERREDDEEEARQNQMW